MRRALMEYAITGISTNIDYHLAILGDPDFVSGAYTTQFIDGHPQLVEAAQEWEERRRPFQRVLRDPARAAAIAAAAVAVGP
jgi:pyruvate carboxylase subunit A